MQTNQAAALGAQLRPTEDEIAEAIYMPLFRHLMDMKSPANFHDREDIAAKAAQQTVALVAKQGMPPPYMDHNGKFNTRVLLLAHLIHSRRLCDYMRRLIASAGISLAVLGFGADGDGSESAEDRRAALADPRPSPASLAEHEDMTRFSRAAMAALGTTARAAMLLRLESDGEASDRAIARQLGLSARGVGKAIARARKFLGHICNT